MPPEYLSTTGSIYQEKNHRERNNLETMASVCVGVRWATGTWSIHTRSASDWMDPAAESRPKIEEICTSPTYSCFPGNTVGGISQCKHRVMRRDPGRWLDEESLSKRPLKDDLRREWRAGSIESMIKSTKEEGKSEATLSKIRVKRCLLG